MWERDNGSGADVTPPREDRPHGVLLTYWLGARVGNDPEERDDDQDGAAAANEVPRIVDVEVLDFEGRVVRTFSGTAERGMNRVTWDLREDPPTLSGPLAEFRDAPPLANDGGVRSVDVLPGSFTVRISSEGAESLRMVEVRTDDRVDIEMVDRIAKYQAVKRALELDARLSALRAAVASVHDELLRVSDWMRDRGFARDGELVEISQTLGDELAELADFRGVMRYRTGVIGLTSSYDEPTEGQRLDLIRMEEELDEVMRRVGDFLILDINRFGDRVDAAGLDVSFFIGPIG